MTTQMKTGEDDIAVLCTEEAVETYLRSHSEFFVDHPDLLTKLEVPHPAGGAISLIERQVAFLRQENKQHRDRIKDLVEIARSNKSIIDKLHQLTLELVLCQTLMEFNNKLKRQLCDHFSANHVRMVLFKEDFSNLPEGVEFVSRADGALLDFDNILTKKSALCGRFNASQLTFLFGENAEDVKSMALIPLIDKNVIGMLAVGNASPMHYKANMGTSFISSLGEIASTVLIRLNHAG